MEHDEKVEHKTPASATRAEDSRSETVTEKPGHSARQHGTRYQRQFQQSAKAEEAERTAEQDTLKHSKLSFSEDERPPDMDGPKLTKAKEKSDRIAERLNQAEKKLPTRCRLRMETVSDPEAGTARKKPAFEKEVKSKHAHLKGPLPLRPIKAGGNAAIGYAHRKVYQVEEENVGVKGAHRTELAAESGLRMAYHRHKTAPYRKVSKLQRKAAAAEAQVAYQQVLQEHPELEKNHLARLWQKKKLQRQYAKAARETQKTSQRVKDTAVTTEKITKRVVESVKRHPVAWGIVGLLLLLIFLIASVFASFSNIGTAGLNVITASSYLAEDVDLNAAELTYTEWETDLEIEIRNVESARPGYDEYRYQIDAIEHDPYILMSYLTAVYQDFTYASVQGALRQLFESQYALTYTEETEIRYRTETFTDPETGESYEEEVPYEWHILNVRLSTTPMPTLIVSRMDQEQREICEVLLESKGNRQYVKNVFGINWLPYVSSYYGYRVHPISGVKNYHTGIDIAMPSGTEILAGHDGTVTLAGEAGGYGLCVAIDGVAYNAYTSESGSNSDYLALLPESSQRGLMLTALYGWQPGAELPISGINADDWKMATQCILWEYQQQLRSDPYSLHDNYLVTADQYYKIIAERPAERAYNWILEQIAKHSEIPSFTGATESSAPTLELKWDSAAKVYTLTVTDTNSLNEDLELLSGSGVSVTRNGSDYTFTSRNMISDPITFTFRKNIPVADEMLIWGRPGYQTMLTGASDPVTFAVKIKTETYGKAQIIKTSEDGVVSGLPFHISGNGVEMDVATDADGTISADLLPGVYLVSELPVDRYVTPASQYITVESGATSTVHFSNVLKKFRIHAVKKDAATGTAQGDATLAGAVYGLYLNGELVDTYTTGPDAEFTTRYYACGDGWTLREIQPSTGYLLNDTVYEVGSNPSLYEVELNTTENTVSETVISGSIRIVKHTDEIDPDVQEEPTPQAAEADETEPVVDDAALSDDVTADSEDIFADVDMPEEETEPEAAEPLLKEEPEALAANHVGMIERPEKGAQFQIFLSSAGSYDAAKSSERDLLVTDSDGFASSKQLPYGRYTVHQIYGEEGKAFVPDFTVFISENGQVYSYILNNTTITARIRVEKRDSETGELIRLTGTGFRIRNVETGEYVTQEIYYPNPQALDVFYVSDEGWLMLPEPLPMGEFELIEVSVPFGYVLSSEPISFTVDGSEETVTVVQYNAPQKGRITISKQGEVFASVMENAGLYQPVYQVMGLSGAVYDVIADEDIYTRDGTLRVAKDTVVETLTTGDDSTATTDLLYLGRYRLEERTAPAGMVLNETPEYVELTYARETVEVTATSVALYDERQKAAVELKKSLEQDKLFDLGLGEEYKDISFGFYAAYDLEAVDGSVIPAGGLLEVVSVQVDGDHYAASFATDLPMGAFYVKERTTNESYILSDKEYPVEFGYAGQNTGLVTISVNDGTAIENELLRGRISGVKYGEDPSGDEDIKLAGAVMGLFPGDAEKFTEDTALMTVTTSENGAFAFEDVPFGHWIVAEIAAPAFYTVSPEQHHVYINADDQVIEIHVEDTLIRGSVQLRKTEAVNEPSAAKKEDGDSFLRYLPGAVFELYEDTNGDKQFDSGDKKIGTLTETDTGFHTAEGLLAKGYFVKEKIAPENYKLDENAYYFSITEDGQIAVIENGEKGYGFSNEAYRGNLKIVKDSSDGRKDGFAIEVKSADGTYREVFTTPKDGVIEITGLRIGKYTVTELSNRASQGYIIPDPATVEIKEGQTAIVQLFNEKPAKSVPQTGDDYSVYLWAGLMLLSLIGCGGAVVLCLRKGGKYLNDPKRGRFMKFMVLGLCGALLIGSGCMLGSELRAYRQSSNAYDEIAALVQTPEETTHETEGNEISLPTEDETAEEPAAVLPLVDFTALREAAPNVVGWLMQEDTTINHPITQAENNDYYLTHLYDGTYNKAGCLFSDYENRADFSDRSTIIYGHNMRDGSMFASLNQYRKQSYYDAHPTMTLLTPEGGYVVELFAAFNASPKESGKSDSPWRLDFENDADFTIWLSAMASRSQIQTETAVTARDKVLTLSTCNGSGDRFIVMGKLTAVN